MSIVDIKIPSPGESITEVEIGSWQKADGDYVQVDETICEIESDKATLPLIADNSGTLKIVLQEGETAEVTVLINLLRTLQH
jgi:2-oxoglutarate dehydrogenase E2 component (dihydrolipoamide succinyltransferase)